MDLLQVLKVQNYDLKFLQARALKCFLNFFNLAKIKCMLFFISFEFENIEFIAGDSFKFFENVELAKK